MTSAKAIGLLVWFLSAVWSFASQSKQSGYDAPIWNQEVIEDLSGNRTEGFSPSLLVHINPAGVVFLDDQQLIVYALEPSGKLSSRRSSEISSAFQLRVRILDVQSGKVKLSKDFNARPHGSAVQVTTGGVLINTGEIVQLYSIDFAKAQNLTSPAREGDMSITSTSPTGKTIMINHFNPKWNVSHLDVFDAMTLTLKWSWSESPRLYDDYSISDMGIAAARNPGISVTDFGQATWAVVGKGIGNCGGNVPTLYSNDGLVYGCSKFIAASINGQILMTEAFSSGDWASAKKAVAQGGRFIAVSVDTVEAKKHLFMEPSSRVTATHIEVYDLAQKKRLFALRVNPFPKNDYDFALSPDGSNLAILNDRNVSVWSVPIPST
jgi:hypothetical protein